MEKSLIELATTIAKRLPLPNRPYGLAAFHGVALAIVAGVHRDFEVVVALLVAMLVLFCLACIAEAWFKTRSNRAR